MTKYMLISATVIEADTQETAKEKLRDQLGTISDQATLISISDELGHRATIDPVPIWPPAADDS